MTEQPEVPVTLDGEQVGVGLFDRNTGILKVNLDNEEVVKLLRDQMPGLSVATRLSELPLFEATHEISIIKPSQLPVIKEK